MTAAPSSLSSTSSSITSNTRSAPAIADSSVFHWFARSLSGRVNCREYSTKTMITPTVIAPRIAKIPPTPATSAKPKLFSAFISFGMKPDIVCAQNPDCLIASFRSLNSRITRSSCEKALMIRWPDSVSSIYPFSSPRFFWRSL
ncbi:hypothetical protein D3C77_400350 [compost metagenome]